jgi:hypothetical protein
MRANPYTYRHARRSNAQRLPTRTHTPQRPHERHTRTECQRWPSLVERLAAARRRSPSPRLHVALPILAAHRHLAILQFDDLCVTPQSSKPVERHSHAPAPGEPTGRSGAAFSHVDFGRERRPGSRYAFEFVITTGTELQV